MDDMQKPIDSDGLEEPYFGIEKCFPCPQVEKLEEDRDEYRRTLEEIDRECAFTENEGLKRIRAMARAVLYPKPVVYPKPEENNHA